MNNLIYLNKDPILMELNSSVDKNSTKKMLAFKFFNGDEGLLEEYRSVIVMNQSTIHIIPI